MGRGLRCDALALSVPYAAWMAMLFALPGTAWSYAVRSLAVAGLLIWPIVRFRHSFRLAPCQLLWGTGIGILVLALWVLPEHLPLYRRFFSYASEASGVSPYDPAVCGRLLWLARLFGSAFVIAPAEEMFFRSFLYRRLQSADWRSVDPAKFDLSAFLWTTALFALEHDRWLVGAIAGAAYAFAAIRHGLASAITAHVVTNLLLGLWVLYAGEWGFW